MTKIIKIINQLLNKEKLDIKNRDHALINTKQYKNCRECHIEPDWLLVYKYIDDRLILMLINTGSHSEILE